MTVLAYADQSVTLDVGDEWVIRVVALDDDNTPVSAIVTAQVTDPAGSTSTPTVTVEDPGIYTATTIITASGRHLAVMTVSGGAIGVAAFTAWASNPTTAGDWPDVSEVMAYLGDTSATDAEIADALAAELAAQRSRCRIPAAYPDDLRQALKRRVARNLAARQVPVAQFTSFEGGGTTSRVPMRDPEIARLEAPYAKRTVR